MSFLPPTCRSCVAVALCSGFLTRHFFTKSVNSSDQSSGFLNVGGGLVGIIKIAWKNKRFHKVRLENKGKKQDIKSAVLYAPANRDFLPILASEARSWVQAPISSISHVYTHSHGMDVSIGRFALCHLYGCDAQRPNVSHAVVADLLDHLWGHPERSTNHSVSLCHGILQRKNNASIIVMNLKVSKYSTFPY